MNYFPFHLGDYASHTAHLEPMEDLAYRRMLDLYYLREGVLPLDVAEIARLTRLKTFQKEIASILSEFFECKEDGWFSVRCDAEIIKMKDKQAKAKASAQASVIARSTNAQRTLNERSTNGELPTPTPTPTPTPIVSKDTKTLTRPDDVTQTTWDDYLKVRKAKNAALTKTGLDRMRKQGEQAGLSIEETLLECIDRSWAGFKVDWYLNSNTRSHTPMNKQADIARQTVPRDEEKEKRMAEAAEALAKSQLAKSLESYEREKQARMQK